MRSPFEITKAVDLEDPEIESTYISFRRRERSIVDPASAMPQFLTGVKGGGRTHLMRHYSYPLQKARARTRPLTQIQEDGYLGVYFRCSGLNGSRFTGKGQPADTWSGVFAYYMDLWITELLVTTLQDLGGNVEWAREEEARLADVISRLLQLPELTATELETPFTFVRTRLAQVRAELDWAVNNAAHTGKLQPNIRSNPGDLIFQTCRAAGHLPGLEGIRITFLADEYENLDLEQQVYFNTLIREKEAPASFLVGGRRWGLRTHRTLSAGEENKKGSEYELHTIETIYARNKKAYEQFCRDMILVRMRAFGLNHDQATAWIDRLSFDEDDRFLNGRLQKVLEKYAPDERPHLVRLRASITKTQTTAIARKVAESLSFPDHPLVEKLAILRFYQLWAGGQSPSVELAQSARQWVSPLIDGGETTALSNFFTQRKSDAVAQIYRDADRKSTYAGFRQLVGMSGYLPRSLLMILKYVSHWADFNGENVFEGSAPISERALSEGVRDAARWYLSDATPLGTDGVQCHTAVTRLGEYFESMRYSDKPREINITTFSSNLDQLSPEALAVLLRCVAHGLLVEVDGGRSSRNHGARHRKFQLHPMLTPLWGLSPGRRGDATLTTEILEAIFNPTVGELPFRRIREALELEVNAPFTVATDTRRQLF
ncbi:hypothetical protein SAMN04488591_2046 [Microbacterium azadirachtae]|uniref:Uncharacterized protein n=1 Tax=Microbacterium azadirachtae TaxID=582680 RepID=A0A1I6HRD2_9MICO|nr:hypothetical protein [Microbacterium azadirachtae]SFR56958.1 hypothetical protein SAMN04488591_2046 [Microbacterium azadirachtae]